MPRIVPVSVLALALLFWAGCFFTGARGGSGGMRDIQLDEIRASQEDNLLALIERIRPSWVYFHELRDPADPEETAGPLVIVNDVPAQPLFTLQYIPLEQVIEVRYLTASFARQRYRIESPAGVILVITPSRVGPGEEVKPDTGRIG